MLLACLTWCSFSPITARETWPGRPSATLHPETGVVCEFPGENEALEGPWKISAV